MSDKRRRYRKLKDEKRPTLLERPSSSAPIDVQPKILLKTRPDKDAAEIPSTSAEAAAAGGSVQRTIIVTRSDAVQSPSLAAAASPNNTQESVTIAGISEKGTAAVVEPVPQMTRPVTVISSMGFINANAKKLLMKSNTDFLVVGVVGAQGVGKSTILNILANEQLGYDYYTKVFVDEDCIFPTKLKQNKCFSRSRTESTHMFITTDRMILLDTPPVLCNSYSKDMTSNELDDLRNIITLLSVCHLLIVVQDDYFNMSFMRLLRLAELIKPTQDNKPFISDHFPNVMFLRNRAKRVHFENDERARHDNMLKVLFKESLMRIYLGQTVEQQKSKKSRPPDHERIVNSFLLPDVKGAAATSYHDSLSKIIDDFRVLVFTTPRSNIFAGSADLSELVWFELLSKVSQDTQHFFFQTYEDIHRRHLEVNCSGHAESNRTASAALSVKDSWRDDNWRDK